LKILTLISGGDVGGAKTHVLSLLRELCRTEQVRLICFTRAEFSDDAEKMGIPTTVMTGGFFSSLRKLRGLIEKERFDIIHSHGSRGNVVAALLKRSSRLPLVSTVHSDWRLDYMGRPLAALTYGLLNAIALRRMDWLTAVSDSMAKTLISRRFAPNKIFTIYNGIEMTSPAPPQSRSEFLKARNCSFGDNTLNVGIVARLNPVKDISTLLRGFASASADFPELRLLIAGEGPDEPRLRLLASELKIDGKVAFLGWVEDTESFYGSIDINTLSSLSETFPYVLTEGARFSLPTVSSRVGGVPQLIDHGVTGLLFDPGDADGLARQLKALAKDEALRRTLGARLRERTDRLYSLEATRQTQLGIYESILRRNLRGKEKRYGVAICGSYGRGNSGDEAILEAILAEIREADPDIPVTVLSVRPSQTRIMHRVNSVHTFSIPAFMRLSRRIRLYINGGGSLIQDVTSRRSLWFYLYTIAAAKKRGAKVLMYGCGIGPVKHAADRRLAGRIINKNVDIITLREDNSVAELSDLGVDRPDIRLAADPSLTLPAASGEQIDGAMLYAGLEPDGRYICFLLREWNGFYDKTQAIAEAAERAYAEYGLIPVFIPINHLEDIAPAKQVAKHLSCPYAVLDGYRPPNIMSGMLSRMSVIVSMRLHGLIFAAGHGVPLVGVVYDPKVSSFLLYIGQELFCDLKNVSLESLNALVDRAIARGSSEEQAGAVARLWELEKVNRAALRELL